MKRPHGELKRSRGGDTDFTSLAGPRHVVCQFDQGRCACSTARMWAVCERSIPPRPRLANLDATTLCALVSLLSNDDASKPWYADWARGNPHWEQCRQQVRSHCDVAYCCLPLAPGRCLAQVAGSLHKARHRARKLTRADRRLRSSRGSGIADALIACRSWRSRQCQPLRKPCKACGGSHRRQRSRCSASCYASLQALRSAAGGRLCLAAFAFIRQMKASSAHQVLMRFA